MVFVVYILVCYLILAVCAKNNIELPNNDFMIIVAILISGEINYWKK